MRGDGGDHLGIHIEDAAALTLLLRKLERHIPELFSSLGSSYEERLVTVVGRKIVFDEASDVYLFIPGTACEALPSGVFVLHCFSCLSIYIHFL